MTGIPASSLCLPLRAENGRVLGVLNINRYRKIRNCTEKEMALLQQASDTLTLAVENVRLHRKNRARIDELARLNRDLDESNRRLGETQLQLLHAEKMVSIGHLAAELAHEINNPLGCSVPRRTARAVHAVQEMMVDPSEST